MSNHIATAQPFEHPGGLHSRSQIETSRAEIAEGSQPWAAAYELLIEEVEQGLEKSPEPVEDFSVPGRYIDKEGHIEAMGRLSNDGWLAYSNAVAYQLTTGEERDAYANKAVEVIDAWATTNKKTSNYDGELAMADAGVSLVFAAELIRDYEGWSKAQRKAFKDWLINVYLAACTKIAESKNNWGDWGTLGSAAAHYYLDDGQGLDADIERVRQRINASIEANGEMPHETQRDSRGIWYTYFALTPMTATSQIAANARGVDLFNYKGEDGAGIEDALDYLIQYCRKPEDWPHYTEGPQSIPPDPGKYPGNLYEAMFAIYGNEAYGDWVKDARPIMVYGHHYAWNFPTLLQPTPPPKESQK
ncbi:alginate lyase family protein [Rubellicoccus peritrichatus]|uniref:Alginate lyase family protein n=1 Tax=Rubellicoccus peritrichatus TaxID=3080537 RepID=A0AAQ3LC63_9BACT|nr:alginate lyase family protein [Puniceicoccus sp. CR14]WOO43071.1 alginate lyase family protein [Puniceicoccus sp. CR14]